MFRWSLVLPALLLGQACAAPIPPPRRGVVEVVLCVDTTRDMQGALAELRSTFAVACGRCLEGRPRAQLRVGLVVYRDRGDEYVTRVFGLTDDLSAVQHALDELHAGGGGDAPEAVNQALHEAVHLISWSAEKGTSRQIVLLGSAPPHSDRDQEVPYPVTCEAAAERGIVIHTVLVGDDEETAACWREIAARTGGRALRGPGASVGAALRSTDERR